ncbi:tumor necrosis factor alpha-induced protein 2-like isoform X2 [Mugil cephalus]|uniref:tumor necrosis factor alpha-induced protein 2-like isoform X2 n=1 Tax=Mugil cephalus TaxID=48193 RepID=UPI001FB708B2|nr:tumor necrosis factor alpha-induced protein 2-like isoform X2 [Mugil cephalus]
MEEQDGRSHLPPPLLLQDGPAPPGSYVREQTEMSGGAEENKGGGGRKRMPRLKIPAKIWRTHKKQNQHEELDCVEKEGQKEEQQEEQQEEVCRRLILREELLFSQDAPSEEEEEELQRDVETLTLQIKEAIENTFSSSPTQQEVLRRAVASIMQQEAQDRRWAERPEGRVPAWRPLKSLSRHNALLQNLVMSRLMDAAEDEPGGMDILSSTVKRQVCRLGKRVKEDLLMVAKTVKDCYPPHMDILNIYAGLYHQTFSVQLDQLAAPGLEPDDCSYLLYWVNHCYPQEILRHEELDGLIKTACLGSLLLPDQLNLLEEQYLSYKEDKVRLWLNTALKKEEDTWLSGSTPELIDNYYFSPLAVDAIQVMNNFLTEFNVTIKDQSRIQRLTVHLENFLCSYMKCVEELVSRGQPNGHSVLKAQLVCEQQLRDYITDQTGSLTEEQRCRCLRTLSALKDCGYRSLTSPLQLKMCLRQLWTTSWMDGSLPVIDSLLDSLNQQLSGLTDLKPDCRQDLLAVLHQDVVLQYVKKMMKSRMKRREEELAGAQRMIEDARKMDAFFLDEGCIQPSWLCELLCSLAEILQLQDPASVQLELVNLARNFPDLSAAHVLALLNLKPGLSAADVQCIKRSVKENRLLCVSANHSPAFFSKVKVKWMNNKINHMTLSKPKWL